MTDFAISNCVTIISLAAFVDYDMLMWILARKLSYIRFPKTIHQNQNSETFISDAQLICFYNKLPQTVNQCRFWRPIKLNSQINILFNMATSIHKLNPNKTMY